MSTTPDFITTGKHIYSDPGRDVFVTPDGAVMLVDPFFPNGISLSEAPSRQAYDFLRAIARALDREDVRLMDLSHGAEVPA